MNESDMARRLIGLIDLTDLSEPCTQTAIDQLCAKAKGPLGPPAALCVWPQFVGPAQRQMGNAIPIATVINFPSGDGEFERVLEDIDEALSDGADEIDLVFPWRAFLAGDEDYASALIAAAKERIGARILKVILETGALPDKAMVRQASECALEAGADFLKTSTGKIALGATPEVARVMLEAIRDYGNLAGFKASGGIRDLNQAMIYYQLFEEICVEAPRAARFRIGASALFDDLVLRATHQSPS